MTSIMGVRSTLAPFSKTYVVDRWGKGKEELGTRVTLYSYRIYVQKSTSRAYGAQEVPAGAGLGKTSTHPPRLVATHGCGRRVLLCRMT